VLINGESRKEVIRPDFNRAIRIVLRLPSSEVSWGWGCGNAQIFEKIIFSREFVLSWRPMRGFGSKNRNLPGFSPGKEVPKTIFKLRWPGLPHNLGLSGWLA
jgi:hypothetical protein